MSSALAVTILPPIRTPGSGDGLSRPRADRPDRPRLFALEVEDDGARHERAGAAKRREETYGRASRLKLVAFDEGAEHGAAPFDRYVGLAFLAQHIAQERMDSGLAMEPWRAVVGAYSRGERPPASVDVAA
jgi:hypothetical protein